MLLYVIRTSKIVMSYSENNFKTHSNRAICTLAYTIGNNGLYLFTLYNDKRAGHIRDSFQVSFKVFESSLEYLLYGVLVRCLFCLYTY